MSLDLTSTFQDLVDAIADAVVAKMGGTAVHASGGTDPEVLTPDPAYTSAPATTGKRTRKSAGAPPPETQPTAVADTEAQAADAQGEAEPTTDLVTPEMLVFSKETADTHPINEVGNELLEYYVSCGHSKEEISAALAEMKEPAKRAAYHDYIARLVTKVAVDAKANGKYIPVLDTAELNFISEPLPYVAERIYDGVVTKVWVNWAVTMSPEDISAAGLPDPATVGVPAAPAATAAAPRRTLPTAKAKAK